MNSYIWIHIFMNSYMNSESIHLNSYTWIHILMNSYIHFIYEFRCIWIHIIISYMNSYNDYMNLYYVYEFIYMNSYMNSYKLWIHMIFSYMNSYVSWNHIWIRVYQGSRWPSSASTVTISKTASNKGWCCSSISASSSRAPVLTQLTLRQDRQTWTPGLAMLSWQGRSHFRRLCSRALRLRGPGRRPGLVLWSCPSSFDRVVVAWYRLGASWVKRVAMQLCKASFPEFRTQARKNLSRLERLDS